MSDCGSAQHTLEVYRLTWFIRRTVVVMEMCNTSASRDLSFCSALPLECASNAITSSLPLRWLATQGLGRGTNDFGTEWCDLAVRWQVGKSKRILHTTGMLARQLLRYAIRLTCLWQ
eukprot:4197826-Amphidinium_carterae.1